MQQNLYCIFYNDKLVYIAEGGVQRNGNNYFFIAILTVDVNQKNFVMWGGYSFSSDHSGRDMIGYESVNGNFYDLYSLYASAPF